MYHPLFPYAQPIDFASAVALRYNEEVFESRQWILRRTLVATISLEDGRSFPVDPGTKLVLALEDHGVDILHRCGGNARCTTCRVEVLAGDAGPSTDAEWAILEKKGFLEGQFRLSCQVHVKNDLTVRPAMTVASSGLDAGPRPAD